MNEINIDIPLENLSIEDYDGIFEVLDRYNLIYPISVDEKVVNVSGEMEMERNTVTFLAGFDRAIKESKLGLKYVFDKKERKLVERETGELPTILTFDLKNDKGLEFTLKRLHQDGFGIGKFRDSQIHFAFAYENNEERLLQRYGSLIKPANSSVIDVHKDFKLDLEKIDLVDYN
jgi:hypothetical protein